MSSSFVQYGLVLLVLGCIQYYDCHPILKLAVVAPQTTVGAPGQLQPKINPFSGKIRQIKTALMAFVQKKIDELRIICSTLSGICPQGPLQTQEGVPFPDLSQLQLPGLPPLSGVQPGQTEQTFPGFQPWQGSQQIPGVQSPVVSQQIPGVQSAPGIQQPPQGVQSSQGVQPSSQGLQNPQGFQPPQGGQNPLGTQPSQGFQPPQVQNPQGVQTGVQPSSQGLQNPQGFQPPQVQNPQAVQTGVQPLQNVPLQG